MKNKITTISLVVVTILSVAYTNLNNLSLQNELKTLKDSVNNNTNKVVVYEGKDGYTPVKGIDYFDGAAGLNSVSFSTVKTEIKEVPLLGEKGDKGRDGVDGVNGTDGQNAPVQETRVNSESKNIETKLSDSWQWRILVSCSEYRLECPNGQ